MEHISDKESDFDFPLPDTQPLTPKETEGRSNSNQNAIRVLKKYLETLGRFFVFAEFVKTEIKTDGYSNRPARTVHTGKAQCMQKQCRALGKKGLHSFTTQSRYHLKNHYEKMHKALVPELTAALEELKRGMSKSRESNFTSKRRQNILAAENASFSKHNLRSNNEFQSPADICKVEYVEDEYLLETKEQENILVTERFCDSNDARLFTGFPTWREEPLGSCSDPSYGAAGGSSVCSSTVNFPPTGSKSTSLAEVSRVDEYDIFGRHIANELRSLPSDSGRRWAKYQIQKVMYEAYDK